MIKSACIIDDILLLTIITVSSILVFLISLRIILSVFASTDDKQSSRSNIFDFFNIDLDDNDNSNDNYDKNNSHFFPALIKKIHELRYKKNKTIILWGNGKPKREVIHVDDLADACVFFMKKKTKHFLINIGTGKDYSIKFYLELIAKTLLVNTKIKIKYDRSKPNGVLRKVMDVSLAKKYGWKLKISLKDSILMTYKTFLKELNQ